MSGSRTVDQISSQLDEEEKVMHIHQKNGNYADAEQSRLKIQQLKKDLEARTLLEMDWRHKREQYELNKANNDELMAFYNLMDQKLAEINQEGEKAEQAMLIKHKQELDNTRKTLQAQLSTKVKESSELLNLREMEKHAVSQHKYDEADKIQKKRFEYQKIENKAWLEKREEKIRTSLNTLKAKQNVQLTNLKKRFKTLADELLTQRKIEEDRLLKKHENFVKDLKSQQEKETLNYKGEFRSKGGRDSPVRTKSSFTN